MADETKIVGLKVGVDTGSSAKNVRELESASGSLLSGLDSLTKGVGGAEKALAALAGGLAVLKLADYVKDATLLAARVETLGVVMRTVGGNAGYTSQQMDAVAKSIAAQGITTEASRQASIRLAQAQVNLSKSSDLARIAQDAAVIAQTNSSDAFERMTTGIATGQAIILHHMGLMVNFEKAYKDYGETVGKTAGELTEYEKTQARVDEVMKAGAGIAGSYESAMGTAGKQLTSLTRYFEEIKLAVGEPFTEMFSLILQDVNHGLKDILSTMKDSKGEFSDWGHAIASTYRFIRDEVRLLSGDIAGLQSLYTGATQLGLKSAELGTRFLTIGQFDGGFGAMADAAAAIRKKQLDAYRRGREADDAYKASLAYGGPVLDPKEAMMLQMAKDRKVKTPKREGKEETYTETDASDQLWNSYLSGLKGFNDQIRQLNPDLTDFQKKSQAIDDTLAQQLEKFKGFENNPGVQRYVESLKTAAAGAKSQLTLDYNLQGTEMTPRQQYQFDDAARLSKWAGIRADYDRKEEQDQFTHGTTMLTIQQQIDQAMMGEEVKKTGDYEQMILAQYDFEQEQAEAQLQWTLDHTALEEEQKQRIIQQYQQKYIQSEQSKAIALRNMDRETNNMKIASASNYTSAAMNFTNALSTFAHGKNRALFELNKVAGIANATMSTYEAANKAMASVPYPYNIAAAASVIALGLSNVASIASTSFGSGNAAAGGTGGGTATSPVVTQPSVSAPQQQVQIVINGAIGERRWFEDNLPAILQDFRSRDVNTGVVYA